MQQQIAVGTVVDPGLVGCGGEQRSTDEAIGRAVADVEEPAIVDLRVPGAVGIAAGIVPPVDLEPVVEPGVVDPAVVGPEAIPFGSEVQPVAAGPEIPEPPGPCRFIQAVKRGQRAVVGHIGQIAPVGCQPQGIIDRGSQIVGGGSIRAVLKEPGCPDLKPRQAGMIPAVPIADQRSQRGIQVADVALQPAPRKIEFRRPFGAPGRAAAKRVQSGPE